MNNQNYLNAKLDMMIDDENDYLAAKLNMSRDEFDKMLRGKCVTTEDKKPVSIIVVDEDKPKVKNVVFHRNGHFTPEGDKMIHNLESTLRKKGLKIIKDAEGHAVLDEKGQIEVRLMKSNFTPAKKKRR